MSRKSGFHRQIWPKSVTHLHGITQTQLCWLGYVLSCNLGLINPTVLAWMSCVSLVTCETASFPSLLVESCPASGWQCCWEIDEHTVLWLGGTLQRCSWFRVNSPSKDKCYWLFLLCNIYLLYNELWWTCFMLEMYVCCFHWMLILYASMYACKF